MLARSNELLYQYEPYFNRSDGKPSWQWDFFAAAATYRGRVAVGANQIGKTLQGAYEAVLAVTGQHPFRKFPKSGRGWVVGLDNKMIARNDLPDFNKFLPERYRTRFDGSTNIWYCDNEAEDRHWIVEFLSTEMGADKFQGAKVDWIWFDEEPKKTLIFNECMMRLIAKAGVWWMTATPLRGTAWLKKLIERDDIFGISAGLYENPYISLDQIEHLKAEYTEDEIDTRIYGKYIVFGGNPVFSGMCRTVLTRMINGLKDDVPVDVGTIQSSAA